MYVKLLEIIYLRFLILRVDILRMSQQYSALLTQIAYS